MTAIGNSNNTFKLLHRELATHPQGHSDRFETLCSLAARLGEGFVETSRVSLLEEALKLAHEALEFYAPDPKRHHFLDILVTLLHYHHTRFGDKASLDDAERYSQEIITLCPLGSPMHDRALIIFATVLRERALNPKYAPDPNDIRPLLERSLSHAESALELRPEGHPQRDDALEALSLTLFGGRRWLKDDTRRTVDRAILLGRAALALRPPGHPKRRTALQNLAYFLTVKYDQSTIETASLDEGVELNKEALELCPVGHFFRADILVIMAYQYRLLWFRDDNIYFRNEADHASEGALQSLPCDHLRYPNISRMRALALYDEYLHSGKIASLDRSIKLTQDSLALLSLHLRYNGLITLGNMLRSRYQLLGDMQSLTEAINIFTKALDTCPPNNDNRIFALHNMGVILHYEYNLSQNASSLNEASRFLEESTRICPETHSQYGWVRLELASVLLDRYRLQSIPEDYDCSVAIIRDLLSRSELSAIRNEALPVLADALYLKYQECQEAALFKESIEYYGSAILRYPTGNRELHSNIASLSNAYLCAHYSEKNVALSIQYVLEIVQDKYGPPRSRFIEAKKLLSKLHDHWHDVSREKEEVRQNLLSAYQEIIKLLPLLANFGLNLPSRLRELSLAQSLGSDAVTFALSCNEGNTSVEMSENSRSIFWSQALHLRDARFDLLPSAAGQELQDLFEALARPWSSGSDGRIDEDLANRRGMSERVYQILGEVRQIDGLDRFLLGQPFLLLARAADKGPVVILTPNKHGCNALVLLSSAGNWKSIPLPSISLQSLSELVAQTTQFGLSRGERVDSRENDLPRALKVVKFRENRLTSTIAAILRDIWNKIVWPILKVLGVQKSTGRQRPRLHWCPTGDFSFIPLHAAGIYHGSQQTSCSDYVVSSYTPTLTALVQARDGLPIISRDSLSALVVAETSAPGLSHIPYANKEAATVLDVLASSLPTTHLAAHGLDTVTGAQVQTVLDALSQVHVVHLACHGQQRLKDPLDSRFCLRDGPLTVSMLMQLKLPKAFFAFLSACETAQGDREQPDQSIHLAAAMLFTGFRSIVATMWPMWDEDGPKIAQVFYEEVVKSERIDADTIPYALDTAVRHLRESENVSPERWAPFVHIGA